MHGAYARGFFALFCWFLAMGAIGCSGVGGAPSFAPWNRSAGDRSGIESPYERIESLRKLAAQAKQAGAEEQRRVSAELARDIRGEEDTLIRAEIVQTLGAYHPGAEADAVLRAALEDPDADVRMAACGAWARRGGPAAASLLGRTLSGDVDKDVRLAAARALGRTKDPGALAALGQALEDKDPAMQLRAAKSLGAVTGEDFGDNVGRWRQYVQARLPATEQPSSVAELPSRSF